MSSRRLQSSQRNHITTNRCPCQQGRAAVSFASGEQNTVAGAVRQHLAGSFPCVLSLSAQNVTLSCTTCETRFEHLNEANVVWKRVDDSILWFKNAQIKLSIWRLININFDLLCELQSFWPNFAYFLEAHRPKNLNYIEMYRFFHHIIKIGSPLHPIASLEKIYRP